MKERRKIDRGNDSGEPAAAVEWVGVVDGNEAKKPDDKEEGAPDVPARPEVEGAEQDQGDGESD